MAKQPKRAAPEQQPRDIGAVASAGPQQAGIVIENVGPVERAIIPAQPGRITVLTGANGIGKSTVLSAVNALAGKSVRLQTKDGTVGGMASGFGVTLRIGRDGSNRARGELQVEAVEDGVDIASLVDPGLKDPVAADLQRMRAMAVLCGLQVRRTDVEQILGGADIYDRYCGDVEWSDSPVEYLASVKKALEAAARRVEADVVRIGGIVEATEREVENAPRSDITVQQAMERLSCASNERAAVAERARMAEQQQRARLEVRKSLDALESQSDTADSIAKEIHERKVAFAARGDRIVQLRQELAALEGQHQQDRMELDALQRRLEKSREREQAAQAMRDRLAETTVAAPTEQELHGAQQAVEDATAALAVAQAAHAAGTKRSLIDENRTIMRESAARAEALRAATKALPELLANAIRQRVPGIDVTGDLRLVVQGTARGSEYFAELSPGKRWSLALRMAAEAFRASGRPGLLAVPQEAWDGLDGANRAEFQRAVAETDLIVVTAQADRSETPKTDVSGVLL